MTEIRVPTLGESVTEATVGNWFKKPGDAVAVDEPLVELETDKVTLEVPAPAAGVLARSPPRTARRSRSARCSARSSEGAARPPPAAPRHGRPIEDRRRPRPAPRPRRRSRASARSRAEPKAQRRRDAPLAPSVRKIAAETGIEPSTVPGTGKDGRVTKGDVLAAIERAAAAADAGRAAGRRRPGARARRRPTTPRAKSA